MSEKLCPCKEMVQNHISRELAGTTTSIMCNDGKSHMIMSNEDGKIIDAEDIFNDKLVATKKENNQWKIETEYFLPLLRDYFEWEKEENMSERDQILRDYK